jgi:membrane protein DedA with SNARE-associated domain
VPDPVPLLRDVTDGLGAWTYALVAAVVLLETSVGLGLISPGEAVLAVAGAAASVGTLQLAVLLAVVYAFGVAGDSISFAIGRRTGPRVHYGLARRVGITRERVQRVETMYARRGGWILIAGRFVGPVRVFAPFVAGSAGMSYAKFLRFDVVGIALWGSAYVLIGYAFAGSLKDATSLLGAIGLAVFAFGIVVAAVLHRRGGASAQLLADDELEA